MHVVQRDLGATGLRVPALGLGAGPLGDPALDELAVERLLHHALDLGVTLVDTAPSYGRSEERIGRALAGRRDEVVLSTKVGYAVPGVEDWTPLCVSEGVDLALRRLRTDHIDLVHLHSCPAAVLDRDGLVDALLRAVEAGKVRVAAYSGDNGDLDHAVQSGRFVSVQTSINVVDQRVWDRAWPAELGVIAKRSVANAVWRYAAPPDREDLRAYWLRWQGLDVSPDEALRFAAFAPGVHCALVGTTSTAHLDACVAAVARGPLPPERVAALRRDTGPQVV